MRSNMFARLIPDKFILLLLATIALAAYFPAQGEGLRIAGIASNVAIFSLFFFHGLRLAHQAVWDGVKHWRLQLAVLAMTFAAIPLAGVTLSSLAPDMLTPELWTGVLFLCALPSTVQAAIASASMAKGNVAASVIAAAISNLSAVILTPLVFAAMAHLNGGAGDMSAVGKIAGLLLLPFALGQLARAWLADWAARHRVWIGRLDRLTILIAIFVAFSAATNEGIWSRLDRMEFARLGMVVGALLAASFGGSWMLGKALGLSREDRVTLFYSGAHKSLATGAPMARILFPAAAAGMIVIPLMLYHQLQLMISAWLAERWRG
jgi:solute carrier family 10 (sodium/bile acid cotransporter), member 7